MIFLSSERSHPVTLKSPEGWYVGQLEEFPEVISQGKTIDELKDNLMDALILVMEEQREKTKEEFKGKKNNSSENDICLMKRTEFIKHFRFNLPQNL